VKLVCGGRGMAPRNEEGADVLTQLGYSLTVETAGGGTTRSGGRPVLGGIATYFSFCLDQLKRDRETVDAEGRNAHLYLTTLASTRWEEIDFVTPRLGRHHLLE